MGLKPELMDRPDFLEGIRFGMASAVVSAVVIVLSLRPMHKYKVALVAALLAIALVDSLADAYAIWNAWGDVASSLASLFTKVFICGSLALMIVYSRARRGSSSSLRQSGHSFSIPPAAIYATVLVYVLGQITLTILTKHDVSSTIVLFVAAVGLSFVIKNVVDRIETRA